MLDRETLEKIALEAICTCWYYDLADTIDALSDNDLYEIVERDKCPDCE